MAEQHVLTALKSGSNDAGYAAARLIARDWQEGNDHNLAALAQRQEWSCYGLMEELDQLIGKTHPQAGPKAKEAHEELTALREWALKAPSPYVFWTLHGHTFMDEDGDGSCLSCGGRWQLVHDSPTDIHHGRYRNGAGEDPTECLQDSVTHGEAECSNENHDPQELDKQFDGTPCPSCTATCNCDACRG